MRPATTLREEATRLCRGLESQLGIPATPNNRVDVLRNGAQVFPAMLEAIRGARTTIDLLTFQLGTGAIVEEFAEALSARARDGVRVRVLVDAIGSRWLDRSLVDTMRDAGVEFVYFRPPSNLRIWEQENR